MYHAAYGAPSLDAAQTQIDAQIRQVEAEAATAPPALQNTLMTRRRNLIRQRQALAAQSAPTVTTAATRAQFQAQAQARRQARRQATFAARQSARQSARAARQAAYAAGQARRAARQSARAQYFASRRAARRAARAQARAYTAPVAPAAPATAAAAILGTFRRGGRLLRYWASRAYPVGVPLLQSGMSPMAAATQAVAQVGVPAPFRRRVRRRLRLRYRRLRVTPAFVAAVRSATPVTVATAPETLAPGAIPNYLFRCVPNLPHHTDLFIRSGARAATDDSGCPRAFGR